jgi:alkanesulfonate monooxygenase SsuD/methylene tetrahydromethanopterin reductase-like flavin-dependent oxidoreductase (luciferase family)
MTLPPARGPEIAARAAELGYGSFWTAETRGPEAFSLLAAMAAATLQALHPYVDILLGIGISSPVVTK